MIILDEHLSDSEIIHSIGRWYPGSVQPLSRLPGVGQGRDDTLIPPILLRFKKPIFVTVNEKHFWKKFDGNDGYALVCLPLPQDHSLVHRAPVLVRRFLKHPRFVTKAKRCGHVFRVNDEGIAYYSRLDEEVTRIEWLHKS